MTLQPLEPIVLHRHFWNCFPIPSGKELIWVKFLKFAPKNQKVSLNFLLANSSIYIWLLKNALSQCSNKMRPKRRLMYPRIYCEVFQFENQSWQVSPTPGLCLGPGLFPVDPFPIPSYSPGIYHVNYFPSTMCEHFAEAFKVFSLLINLHNTSPWSPITTWSAEWNASSLWSLLWGQISSPKKLRKCSLVWPHKVCHNTSVV